MRGPHSPSGENHNLREVSGIRAALSSDAYVPDDSGSLRPTPSPIHPESHTIVLAFVHDEGGTISSDPWTKRDKKDMEVWRGDLEKLVGWKKTYTYRQIASLSDTISARNQGCAGSEFLCVHVCGLGRAVGFGQKEGRQRGQQSPRSRDAASGLGGREGATEGGGHEDEGAAEGMELTHSLQMESLLATSVPKSRLDAYILAGVQRYLGSSEFALGINDVMDSAMERGARKVVMEIEAARRKDEDIQPILDKYADREMKGKTSAMPRGTQTPPRTPTGPDEEPEIVAPAPPPQGHNSRSRGGGGTSTDSNTNSGDKGKDVASDFPPQPEGSSRGLPATPSHWETSGIPWIDLQLSDPHHDPTNFSLYAAVGSVLVDPNVDRSRGRQSGLEGQLEEALETFRASELCEARRAVIKAKAENDRLDKLWRDMEA
ncbi:OLC1v1036137C1 [Oldenlandia corymbosa var. corymbosa]|uniref:OLC1v1036137C1 n=1 Tax=Oldenlandia corymbosa var. corymbosa TaxID=529605 RepID=A0AAV1CV15_OLDCO|nr:OLC1v1036137C1 [Oldenlandia corymbosa var. corymbosa]